MSDINYRVLIEQSGFERFGFYKGVTSGWKRFLVIPIGGCILLNLKTLSDGVSGTLLVISADSNTKVNITKLSGNGLNAPIVRVTRGGGLATTTLGLEVNLGKTKDIAIEYTELGKIGTAFDTGIASPAGTAVVTTLELDTPGFISSDNIHVNENSVYHAGNLPPAATKSETLLGDINDKFVTPFGISDIISNLQEGIANAGESIKILASAGELSVRSLNIVEATGVMELPVAGIGEWLRFVVHPKVNISNVRFQSSNGKKVVVRTEQHDNFTVSKNDSGVEFRAYVNKTGNWEVLL